MAGYNPNFFAGLRLPLPKLSAALRRQRAPLLLQPRKFELAYTHFSIVQNQQRRFAFFTATNIDGATWNGLVKERTEFLREPRIAADQQTGEELYDAHQGRSNNDFDKGHLVKFQDPQWGDEQRIKQAAADTMFFVNCAPQHHRLNRGAWKSLEDFILKKVARKTGENARKLSLFSGPLLLPGDPFYVKKINGAPFQLPCYYWKLIVYPNRQNRLSAVAFLMSQRNLLFKHGFAVEKKEEVRKSRAFARAEADLFSEFTSGQPYQISISFLQTVTGFSFGVDDLVQPYTHTEPTELVFKRVEVPVDKRRLQKLALREAPLTFTFERITL